jgi:3D (Asp-Asp-Asp) domain-containing protein
MSQSMRSILARSRAHAATVVVAAAAAALVSLGVGTAQRASSGAPGSDSVASNVTVMVVGGDVGGDRASIRSTHPPIIDRAILRRILDRVHSAADFELLAEAFGIPPQRSHPRTTTAADRDPPQMAAYNGRPIRAVATIRMRVTAYSPDWRSCGASADGITASGYSVLTNGGFMVAADPRVLPLGSLVSVPGYDGGAVVPVLDTGGAIKGNRLDVLYPTHEVAMCWGVQELDVVVWEYADGLPSGFRRVRRPAR